MFEFRKRIIHSKQYTPVVPTTLTVIIACSLRWLLPVLLRPDVLVVLNGLRTKLCVLFFWVFWWLPCIIALVGSCFQLMLWRVYGNFLFLTMLSLNTFPVSTHIVTVVWSFSFSEKIPVDMSRDRYLTCFFVFFFHLRKKRGLEKMRKGRRRKRRKKRKRRTGTTPSLGWFPPSWRLSKGLW